MKLKFFSIILFILILFIKGYMFSTKYSSDQKNKQYTVFIESLEHKSENKVAYNVKLLNTNDRFILNIYDDSYDNIKTDLELYSKYKYGDVLNVKGKIKIPQKLNNPGEFDYKQYLYSNNIHGLINTYEIPQKIQYSKTVIERIYSEIYMFKSYITSIITKSMEETNANVAISIIYGDTLNLDQSIQEKFETVGVSHLLSVSGTHITSFMIIINAIMGINNVRRKYRSRHEISNKKRINLKNIIRTFIQIVSILVYIIFTGVGASVIRAGIMLIISIICDVLNKRKNKYKALLIAGLIILFQNPFSLFNNGMILSFGATLGIILFGKDIKKNLEVIIKKVNNEKARRITKYTIENIAITIAVQLLIIPIQINTFNKLPFPIIIPNLVLGLFASLIRVIGTVGIFLLFIPFLSQKIFSFLEIFVKTLVYFANLFKNVSFNISTVSLPLIIIVLYYILVASIFGVFKIKNMKSIATKYNVKKILKSLKVFQIIICVLLIFLVVLINIYSIYFSEYVYFFNVEQGDMSYIKSGNKSIIVDIGSMNSTLSFNTINNYFKKSNLKKVDVVIISHMHKDHINGLENFIRIYDVGMIVYALPKEESDDFRNFKEMLNKYKIKSKQVKQGDKINLGKIKIEVLLPGNEYISSLDEENANSLVCKITVNGKHLLYMGDASKETEEKLIKQNKVEDIFVLKVGHHGSKTATSEIFIEKIKPQNAVISALKKYYGHPHEETINILKENKVNMYLTEQHGAIKFNLN